MTGTRCAVYFCKNSLLQTNKQGLKIKYFKFPKDPALRNVWINKCHRKEKWNPLTSRICSVHFTSNDFQRDLRAELMNTVDRRKLKPDAVPSLHLGQEENENKKQNRLKRENRYNKRCGKKEVEVILKNYKNVELVEHEDDPKLSADESETGENVTDTSEVVFELERRLKLREAENELLKAKVDKCEQDVERNVREVHNLRTIVEDLKKQLQNAELYVRTNVREALGTTFTANQIDILLKEKQKVSWSKDDMASAFTLLYLDKRTYNYLRQSLLFPLPGISTLQGWISKLEMRPGILAGVTEMMKVAAASMTPIEKLTIVQFGRMILAQRCEYDAVNDEIIGPHSHVQVIMLRGLSSNWKQPLFYDFDKDVTRELLFDIIEEAYSAGLVVVACVTDCEERNEELWEQLGISAEKTWFLNQCTNEKVYVFFDTSQLLKMIRKSLLLAGFELQNGGVVSKEPLEALLKLPVAEPNHKLTRSHIECNSASTYSEEVQLAVELFSRTTAAALIRHKLKNNNKVVAETAHFINNVNSWYDIMNSRIFRDSALPLKCGYGTQYKSKQDEILNTVADIFLHLKCRDENLSQRFQRGVVVSIVSLQNLYSDLKSKFNLSHILTYRLNLSSVAHLFSLIRHNAEEPIPSPLKVIHQLRMIIFGRESQKKSATDEYVFARILNVTGIHPEVKETQGPIIGPETSIVEVSESGGLEDKGVEYLAEWIAEKFKDKYPALLNYQFFTLEQEDSLPECVVEQLKEQASEEWIDQVQNLENCFQQLVGDIFANKKYVTENFFNKMKFKNANVPKEVLQTFIKQRLLIHISYLNLTPTEQRNIPKRKLSESDEKLRITKKLKN